MEKKSLVINLNITTGAELSYVEIMNYEKMKTNSSYLQTHCLEFLDDKYKDKFESIAVCFDNEHYTSSKYPNLKEVTYDLLEKLKDKVFVPDICKYENNHINSLNSRINNHLLNMDITSKVIEEFKSRKHDMDIKIFANYLKLINFTATYCDLDNSTKHGAINFNFFNMEQDNQSLWVAMFIHTNRDVCQVFKHKRIAFESDKVYHFIQSEEELDYYIRHIVKAVNKVVLGINRDFKIIEG